MQGIIAGNDLTDKLTVSDYKKVTDKNGSVKFSMHVLGFYLNRKIEIYLKKAAGNVADVIITSTKKSYIRRFSGEVVARAESNYLKRPGEV